MNLHQMSYLLSIMPGVGLTTCSSYCLQCELYMPCAFRYQTLSGLCWLSDAWNKHSFFGLGVSQVSIILLLPRTAHHGKMYSEKKKRDKSSDIEHIQTTWRSEFLLIYSRVFFLNSMPIRKLSLGNKCFTHFDSFLQKNIIEFPKLYTEDAFLMILFSSETGGFCLFLGSLLLSEHRGILACS